MHWVCHLPFAIAGDLQEPPVSSQRDQGAIRAATEAAEPPLLPATSTIICHIAQQHVIKGQEEMQAVTVAPQPMLLPAIAQQCVASAH